MAEHTITPDQYAAHEITLTAGQVETFTFNGDVTAVEVFSHDGAAIIYATIDGTDPTPGSFPAQQEITLNQPAKLAFRQFRAFAVARR